MHPLGHDAEPLDARLASLAREETALRMRLGQALEVLGRGAHFELGFSSVAAYALERCDRSVRWVEAARCLARRVERLPELRRAMAHGKISWSMGELLARVAQPHDEAAWVKAAESRTVRRMRPLVMEAIAKEREARADGGEKQAVGPALAPSEGTEDGCIDAGDETCTLTCTVEREEAWLVEATRALLAQLGVRGTEAECEALLAEGQATLLAVLPKGSIEPTEFELANVDQRRQLAELGRWRAEAEALCEGRIRRSMSRGGMPEPVLGAVAVAAAFGLASFERAACDELDDHVRGLARALARHELELSQLVLRFHRADGFRRLGYASETQYARERLGMSHSSLLARRALAQRLERLPRVAAALGAGQIGVEAALQVVRVATSGTEAAWVERARRRTIKHLREEVAAALTAVRISGEVECPPPVDAELELFHDLEREVVSGRVCQRPPADARAPVRAVDIAGSAEPVAERRRAWFVMLGSLAIWLQSGLQMSAAGKKWPSSGGSPKAPIQPSRADRVTFRWRVSRATYAWWRGLEAQARRWLPPGVSWLRFLCLSMWQAWRHLIGADVAYGQVYIRDRYRCTSPVCSRRDITPHHIRFRSAGGSDAVDNVTTVCSWCHLCGIHGGRIRAAGTAQLIHWELGSKGSPCLVVHGRERMAA
jgi:hypothetical protein